MKIYDYRIFDLNKRGIDALEKNMYNLLDSCLFIEIWIYWDDLIMGNVIDELII